MADLALAEVERLLQLQAPQFLTIVPLLRGMVETDRNARYARLDERAEALLEHGMGLGEYYYIHTLVYHWWLGHDPIDGPEQPVRVAHVLL